MQNNSSLVPLAPRIIQTFLDRAYGIIDKSYAHAGGRLDEDAFRKGHDSNLQLAINVLSAGIQLHRHEPALLLHRAAITVGRTELSDERKLRYVTVNAEMTLGAAAGSFYFPLTDTREVKAVLKVARYLDRNDRYNEAVELLSLAEAEQEKLGDQAVASELLQDFHTHMVMAKMDTISVRAPAKLDAERLPPSAIRPLVIANKNPRVLGQS